MRVDAVYDARDGAEWLTPSLASVYNHVNWIHIFIPEGDPGNVRPVATEFLASIDTNKKCRIIEHAPAHESDLLQFVPANIAPDECDYLLLLKLNHVWDEAEIGKLVALLPLQEDAPVRIRARVYGPSPFYLHRTFGGAHACFAFPYPSPGPEILAAKARTLDDLRVHFYGSTDSDIGYVQVGSGDLPDVFQLQEYPCISPWRYTQLVDRSHLPWGGLTLLAEDEDILVKYAKGRQNAVDLGTFMGRSAALIAEQATAVTTVDIFEDISLIEEPSWQLVYADLYKNHPHPYETIKANLSHWPNIRVVRGLTKHPVAENVDFLFIDGDHSWQGVNDDFFAYLPYLLSGALVLFHDSLEIAGLGVYPWIEEVLKPRGDFEFLETGGSVSAWRKIRSPGALCRMAG